MQRLKFYLTKYIIFQFLFKNKKNYKVNNILHHHTELCHQHLETLWHPQANVKKNPLLQPAEHWDTLSMTEEQGDQLQDNIIKKLKTQALLAMLVTFCKSLVMVMAIEKQKIFFKKNSLRLFWIFVLVLVLISAHLERFSCWFSENPNELLVFFFFI